MQSKVIVLALVLGLTSALPFNSKKSAKPRDFWQIDETGNTGLGVFDGSTTNIKNHPYEVSIVALKTYFLCSGVILTDSWILTDADCTYGFTNMLSDLSIVTGSNNGLSGTYYKLKKIVVHPKHSDENYYFDFALMKIKGKFSFGNTVAKVSLPSAEPASGTSFVVAGYGAFNEKGTTPNAMLQGTMKWESNTTCSSFYDDFKSSSEACAYNKGKVTLCSGDFGVPFVKNGVVYGVMLGGNGADFCTSEALPVILGNVFKVVDWIKSYTGATVV